MTKLSQQGLYKEVTESIICLCATTPLYSIRIEDICNFINEKYEFNSRDRYRSGSIMFALDKITQLELSDLSKNQSKLYKEVAAVLARKVSKSDDDKAKRVGRWRRTSFQIWFIAHFHIWRKFSPIAAVIGYNITPVLKLKLIAEHFFNFFMPRNSADTEMAEGIREIIIVEGTMPVGLKKSLPDGGKQWCEPMSPFWLNFAQLLDQLISELQAWKIVGTNFNAQALRQGILGVMVHQILGYTLDKRMNCSGISCEFDFDQALRITRQTCFGFCLEERAWQEFVKEWPV